MCYLSGRPSKLEDDYETGEVQHLVRDLYFRARDALVVDKEHTRGYTNGPYQVPELTTTVPLKPHPVAFIATKWGTQSICYLAYQHQSTGYRIGKSDDVMVEDEKIGEPHASTQVV